jgi:8-oxo-dGTP pyrophosphatase MutT (NUDIX family)
LKNSPTPAPPLTPRPAATVLLLREQGSGVEVLVIRRHENLAFMGGMWVFPGGALAAADVSPGALACIPDRSKARCIQFEDLHGAALSRTQCLGLAIAAYRETFEETGVLLATDADGNHCRDNLLIRLQAQRRAIAPSNAPRRFDTRFLAIVVPAGQTADIDTIEAVDHAWMTPAALLAAAARGEMPVSQPTLYNLMELDNSLREHGALAAMLRAESDRKIAPVLPKMIREAQTVMVLPWDPEYAALPGEGAPAGLEYPQRLRALPSRLTMRT